MQLRKYPRIPKKVILNFILYLNNGLITTKERIPWHWEKKIKWQSNKQSIRKSSYSGSVCAAFIPTNYWDLISPHYKSCPLQLALVDKLSLKQSLNWRKAVCDSYVSISKEAEELIWKCYKTLTGFSPLTGGSLKKLRAQEGRERFFSTDCMRVEASQHFIKRGLPWASRGRCWWVLSLEGTRS